MQKASEFCALVGMMQSYLERHPSDGVERLKTFFSDGDILISTEEVMSRTGYSHSHILKLCKQGLIPYIPGNPHRFVPQDLMMAIRQLQVGGVYGRRKSPAKKRATLK